MALSPATGPASPEPADPPATGPADGGGVLQGNVPASPPVTGPVSSEPSDPAVPTDPGADGPDRPPGIYTAQVRPASRTRIVLNELLNALAWMPVLMVMTLGVFLVHLTVPALAQAERWRARRLGAPATSGRPAGERLAPWLAARVTTPGFWRSDLPVAVAGFLLSTVSFAAAFAGGIMAVVLVLMPFVVSRRSPAVIGRATVTSGLDVWWTPLVGVLVLVLVLVVLLGVGVLRLRVVTVLSRDRERERAEALAAEVGSLQRGRATLVDAFEAERARIERDLHDGAQQRLTALTMGLGAAQLTVSRLETGLAGGEGASGSSGGPAGGGGPAGTTGPVGAAPVTGRLDGAAGARTGERPGTRPTTGVGAGGAAHDLVPLVRQLSTQLEAVQGQAEAALADLRATVRSVRPVVLTERGLVAAVRELAATSGLEVEVDCQGEDSAISSPVATAVYFALAQALANVAAHAGTRQARLSLACSPTGVRAVVADDGVGGAVPGQARSGAGGTGLAGMVQRLATVGGSLEVDSPPGGGTRLVLEAPALPPWAG